MDDRRLHQVHVAEVLELAGPKVLGAKAGDEHRARLEVALVREVVNRVDGGRTVQGARPFHGVDVRGHQRGLPVIRVNDVGDEAQRIAELQRRAREQREAFEVVRIRLARGTVQVRAIEQAVVLDEVDGDVAARQPPHSDTGARTAVIHGNVQHAVERFQVGPGHPRVKRHHDAHVDAATAERLREGARDIGEASGLSKRSDLGRNEQDLQRRHRRRRL